MILLCLLSAAQFQTNGSSRALVLISLHVYVELPMIRSVLRANRGQILEGTRAETEEGVGGRLAPPSGSGGLCKREESGERMKKREKGGSPASSSSGSSGTAGSLE